MSPELPTPRRVQHMIGCASWPMASPAREPHMSPLCRNANGRRMADVIDMKNRRMSRPVRRLPWQRRRLFTSVIVASRSPRAWVVHSIGGPGRQL